MRLRILSAAEVDLEDGYRFYESQLSGLGSYFLDSLYSDIDSLAYFGDMHPRVGKGIPDLEAGWGLYQKGLSDNSTVKEIR